MISLIHVLETKKRASNAEWEKHIPEPKKNNLLLIEDGKCLNAHKYAYHYSKRIFKTHTHTHTFSTPSLCSAVSERPVTGSLCPDAGWRCEPPLTCPSLTACLCSLQHCGAEAYPLAPTCRPGHYGTLANLKSIKTLLTVHFIPHRFDFCSGKVYVTGQDRDGNSFYWF